MSEHTDGCNVEPKFDDYDSSSGDGSAVKTIMVVVPTRLYREGIEQTLRRKDRIVLSGSDTLEQALHKLQGRSSPDIFIVQIENNARQKYVFSLICQVRAELPRARWIVLSSCSDRQFLRAAIEAGVDDCLLEDVSGKILRSFTDLVLLGHSFMRSQLAHCLVEPEDRSSQLHHLTASVSTRVAETPIKEGVPFPLTGTPHSDVMHLTGPTQPNAAGIWSTNTLKTPDMNAILPTGLLRPGAIISGLGLPHSDRVSEAWPREDDYATPPPLSQARLRDPVLSDREQAILSLLVEGQANKIIARSLRIAEATVKVHVKALFRKMRVNNRTQAAIAAPRYLKPTMQDKPQSLTTPIEAQDAKMLPVKNWSDQSYRAIGKL